LEGERARFDTIVIDPPAFAKRKSALEGARRGYKDLNLRALRLLAPGGTLITCSCSGKMTRELFEELLVDAARDVGRRMVVAERRGAGPDHPVLLGVPETEYLKCFVLRAVD
jgi:23S rRNA (cytosine1962-C5)-methyltransferase